MNGVDPSVAEDLGIPMSPESAERHLDAGKQVAAVLATHSSAVEVPQSAARQEWIDSMHLTGPIPPKTPAEREIHSGHIADLKSHIRPLGDRPNSQEN